MRPSTARRPPRDPCCRLRRATERAPTAAACDFRGATGLRARRGRFESAWAAREIDPSEPWLSARGAQDEKFQVAAFFELQANGVIGRLVTLVDEGEIDVGLV